MSRWLILVAGLVGAAGVGLGAYGAHGLEVQLTQAGLSAEQIAKRLNTCDIAVRYHLVHAVALLALAMAAPSVAPKRRGLAAGLFLVGLMLFCGILYCKALLDLKGLDLIVPAGGLSFILGWLCIAWLGWAKNDSAP